MLEICNILNKDLKMEKMECAYSMEWKYLVNAPNLTSGLSKQESIIWETTRRYRQVVVPRASQGIKQQGSNGDALHCCF